MEILALTPSLLALALAFLTRNAFAALSIGAIWGSILVMQDRLAGLPEYLADIFLLNHLSSPWKMGALILTLQLGAFSALLDKNKSLERLFSRLKTAYRSKRSSLLTLAGAGVLCFYDGLANAILLGRLSKPLKKRFPISGEKLAYIVDTTSSSVACLVFFSTWTAYQLSLIQSVTENSSFEGSALSLLLQAIPFNFYSWMSLLVLFIALAKNINLGPMKTAEEKAERDFQQTEHRSLESFKEDQTTRANFFVLLAPILSLFVSFIAIVLLFGEAPRGAGLLDYFIASLSSNSVPMYLNYSALIAWLILLLTKKPDLSFGSAIKESAKGVVQIAQPCLILFGAWALSSTISDLNLAAWLGESIRHFTSASPSWLPLIAFFSACLVAFLTGTSWGTLALLLPLVVPVITSISGTVLDAQTASVLVPAAIGAVFGGAVFGDHCSPISDTTVVAAFSTDCELRDHTKTQLPYAVVAALAAALLGYLPIALAF